MSDPRPECESGTAGCEGKGEKHACYVVPYRRAVGPSAQTHEPHTPIAGDIGAPLQCPDCACKAVTFAALAKHREYACMGRKPAIVNSHDWSKDEPNAVEAPAGVTANGQNVYIGRKTDAGKPRWDLMPPLAEKLVVDVLTFGAKKYAPENWRLVDGWRWRYFRAAIGHIKAFALGERLDKESGLPHLAHAVCCVLFLLELSEESASK